MACCLYPSPQGHPRARHPRGRVPGCEGWVWMTYCGSQRHGFSLDSCGIEYPRNVIKSAFGKHSVPLYTDFPKLLSTACLEGPIQLGSAEVPVHSLKQHTGGSSIFWALKKWAQRISTQICRIVSEKVEYKVLFANTYAIKTWFINAVYHLIR